MSEKNITVKQAAVIALLIEMGISAADRYNAVRCAGKIKTFPSIVDDAPKPKTAEGKALLKKIMAALEAGGQVDVEPTAEKKTDEKPAKKAAKGKAAKAEVEDDEEAEDEEEAEEDPDMPEDEDEDEESDDDAEEDEAPAKKSKAKKAAKKPAKKAKAEETEDEEEVDEDESEDDEEAEEKPAKKAKKKKAFKRAGGEKGPGVIASIAEFLAAGTKDVPITKAEIHAKMMKRFADRDAESTMTTINTQIPNKLTKEKGLNIKTVEKDGERAYYISKAKAKPAAEEAEVPAKKAKDKKPAKK